MKRVIITEIEEIYYDYHCDKCKKKVEYEDLIEFKEQLYNKELEFCSKSCLIKYLVENLKYSKRIITTKDILNSFLDTKFEQKIFSIEALDEGREFNKNFEKVANEFFERLRNTERRCSYNEY